MKIAITGSHGFIGSNLVKRLTDIGDEVVPISHEYFEDNELLSKLLTPDTDYIFHLAAYGNKYDQENENRMIYSNINVLNRLIQLAKHIPYNGFINFSSSSVMLPYETMYSATKGAGERIVKALVNKHGKPIVNVRPFTVIGKGDNPDHLVSKLVNSCITEDQMLFVGAPVHDYISVDDFIDAVLLVAENAEKLKGQTIDIGTGVQTTNEEVFNIVRRVMNKIPRVNRVDTMRPYDTFKWVANPEVIQSLGWKQKQSIEDVVRSLIS